MENIMSDKSFIEELKRIIGDYIVENDNISVNQLSKDIGVSEPTLRRVVKGVTKNAPSSQFVVRVLKKISGSKSTAKLLDLYPGVISEFLESDANILKTPKDNLEYRNQLQKFLSNPEVYHIVAMAGCHNGVSEDQIEQTFGFEGVKILLALYKYEMITKEEDRYHLLKKDIMFHKSYFPGIMHRAIDLLEMEKSYPEVPTYFYTWTESLNDEGLEKLREMQKQAYMNMVKVLKDEKYHGDKPAFIFGGLDKY